MMQIYNNYFRPEKLFSQKVKIIMHYTAYRTVI